MGAFLRRQSVSKMFNCSIYENYIFFVPFPQVLNGLIRRFAARKINIVQVKKDLLFLCINSLHEYDAIVKTTSKIMLKMQGVIDVWK